MYKPIIESTKQSSKTILLEILDHLKNIYLPGQEKVLSIGFNCSWSYSHNTHQASDKFLYLENLPGYNYQPVIAFHTIENSRSVKYNDSSKIVHKGNFDRTFRQMEHAILLALLNDIIPILEETDFTIHICVDGNLETNRTLACISAVSRIFADLKYISKNIRKNLMKKQYLCWHPFEQHIMSICWNDICWMKNNPELQLQGSTLKNYTQTEIDNFRNVIIPIFCIPFGQELVTTLHTSHNEIFNRKILKYLDNTWHALAVIDQNDGLDTIISSIIATRIDFSYSDACNILKFVQKKSQQELVSYKTEAINAYLNGNDTFVFMKTDGGKTLCYALSAICSKSLIIVFSPLKALMEDQKRELIKVGIPCVILYVNLIQGTNIQEKIFEEIACGLIKILFVIPEKLVSNGGFCRFISQLYKQKKKLAPIMLLTAMCTRLEVDEILINLIIEEDKFSLIHNSTSH
ncbi:hypothetical protein C1645_831335 [Glomus cerebriforme]|uniref:DNA 3'-5' helicase n=1 Tax=Glomus cerebriforme TaxID=658196 RepID=A0A397SQZ5_9GLOM|nr:hypothetical protein C1645_831335 [Glomus cerebriforme]